MPSEIAELHAYGVTRIYSPEDGATMGLQGMIDDMIRQATKLYVDDYAYIPLHQQAVVWAARKNIDLVQEADNTFPLRFVTVK